MLQIPNQRQYAAPNALPTAANPVSSTTSESTPWACETQATLMRLVHNVVHVASGNQLLTQQANDGPLLQDLLQALKAQPVTAALLTTPSSTTRRPPTFSQADQTILKILLLQVGNTAGIAPQNVAPNHPEQSHQSIALKTALTHKLQPWLQLRSSLPATCTQHPNDDETTQNRRAQKILHTTLLQQHAPPTPAATLSHHDQAGLMRWAREVHQAITSGHGHLNPSQRAKSYTELLPTLAPWWQNYAQRWNNWDHTLGAYTPPSEPG